MNSILIFLYLIYIICLIPTFYVYITHATEEHEGYLKSIEKGNEYKATKQLGESLLFLAIATGYPLVTIFLFIEPKSKIPYLVILVGTISIISVYFCRIFGIPILGTDIIIRDLTTDWRDVATKIPQAILLIPISMLYIIRATKLNKT